MTSQEPVACSYALPHSASRMNVPYAISDALSVIQHPGVAVVYRLHKGLPNENESFSRFKGSLPVLAGRFLGADYVDVALESAEPIPFDVAQRFFRTLDDKFEKH